MYARNASRIVQVIGVSHLSRRLSRSLLAAAESERAAQGVERTATREQQIGELEYELEERERKHRKYGHW